MNTELGQKITATHLKRSAFLYIRQSTPRQVLEHTESTARQYALRKRAIHLGWQEDQVIVIDSDLGHSGASAADRQGFQQLVTEVSMGRAGIVLGLEVSRLARNSTDWHKLLEICAFTGTLILDEDGIYDPTLFNDRLLLGLKGTMSEAELHLIRARMRGGLLNKAKRGELTVGLPCGFVYDDQRRVVLDPDQQVQRAIQCVFETFRLTGAAFAVAKAFDQQGLKFPHLLRERGRPSEIIWGDATHRSVVNILRNPRYAGAYFYGRTRYRSKPGGGHCIQPMARQDWHTLILDAHPAYITWQEYEENLQRLQENARDLGVHKRSAVREGPALLQGLLICGICGTRMTVNYHQRQGSLTPNYYCLGPHSDRMQKNHCQSISGASMDKAIGELLVEAMTPLALEIALNVQREIQARWEEADRLRRLEVDRARYEAELSRRRFLRVDPDNRLVAGSLETDWNLKLKALAEAEHQYERQRQADEAQLSERQRERILTLATDFPQLWNDPVTANRERKRMVRLLIEDITVKKQQQIQLQIRFRGGMSKTLVLPVPLKSFEARRQNPEMIAQMDRLLDDYNYRDIARILDEKGFKTGEGLPLTAESVAYIRADYGLKPRLDRLRERGLLTRHEVAQKYAVSIQTVWQWRHSGLLHTHSYNDQNHCLYEDPGPTVPRCRPKPTLRSGLSRGAV
jgi:DNA invertase Pin-like site-specific DNA recombinase